MIRIASVLIAMTFSLIAAVSAQAATLANLSISNGTYSVTDGQIITITGDFTGDASGYLGLADPFDPAQLVFSASLGVNGDTVFDGRRDPLDIPPAFVLFAAFQAAGDLNAASGGGLGAAADYAVAGQGRVDATDVFDFGIADLFFSYTGGITGPASLAGSFTATIARTDTRFGTLTDLINGGLLELSLLGLPVPSGFAFPSTDSGVFEASLSISTVPLPAGLPLLGAGLVGLIALRRRRAA